MDERAFCDLLNSSRPEAGTNTTEHNSERDDCGSQLKGDSFRCRTGRGQSPVLLTTAAERLRSSWLDVVG